MAIVKHLSSKNSNYGDSVDYLTKQYDEKLDSPILDENNQLQEREEYIISYTRSDGQKAPVEEWEGDCKAINLSYNQNGAEGDIKTHHYIVAFENEDSLSLEESQKFGEDLAAEMFPGQNYLVAAHPENHVHIVVNSVRDKAREQEEYMKDKEGYIKPCEYRAGAKHNCSRKFLVHMKERVMKMCQERGLGQSINLNEPAKTKVTDKEYHAQQNAAKKGKLTQKDYIRQVIDTAKELAGTPQEFLDQLKEMGVEVERRGKNVRYKTVSGEKWIREKSLGTDYMLEFIVPNLKKPVTRIPGGKTLDGVIKTISDEHAAYLSTLPQSKKKQMEHER